MADRTRIVHLTTVHHPMDPRIYRKQARSLAKAGFDVWLLARGAGLTLTGSEFEDVTFVPLPDGRDWNARLRRQAAAARKIRQINPGIIHFHDPELIPLAWRLKGALGAKIIYDKHEDYGSRKGVEGKALAALENWAFKWVDHVILAEEFYSKAVGGRGVRYSVVLNYALSDESPPDDRLRRLDRTSIRNLVYTGTVSRARGLFHMIELARHIKRRELDLKIRVVGICNYAGERRRAEKEVAEGHLGDVISFEGWDKYINWAQIREAYLQADAGLMLAEPDPNYVVSIPSKFYEYIQYGLPIVASNISLWKDFLDRTGCGWVVDPSDTDQVVEMLASVGREGSLQAKIEATNRAAAEFEWTQMEPILLGAYRQVEINP